ncbi:MAG: urease accessory protein UreD [Alphaproteobacteria bacterium]|nr:urease accessory protein UreD [Alphaproteobacteria bacterium]MBV9420169.1 urease accessory protein UreD [Alphaproteobacteria bacterium]MBV9541295.1 urease accessory protein UreD [Alphaproteobacteria bacterium]MBV9903629.1 urease accessory protein UreD [Alphaproteobacteria bacterium]
MQALENTAENVAYGPWTGSRPAPREGEVRLALKRAANDETVLRELYHAQPLRVLIPYRDRGDIFHAAIACVSGGLVGGDRFRIDVALDDGCRSAVIGQAAEKVYRSAGAACLVETSFRAGRGAWLEYLPQETILFDQARLRRHTSVTLNDGARFLGGGILVFGRAARGETLRTGFVHDAWTFHDGDGRLVWKDVLHMDGELAALLARRATFDRARAYGSLIYAGTDAALHLTRVREIARGGTLRVGATAFRNLLIVRLVGRDALELRDTFANIWRDLRAAAGGLPAVMPRLWSI